jgi:hypothetical protein
LDAPLKSSPMPAVRLMKVLLVAPKLTTSSDSQLGAVATRLTSQPMPITWALAPMFSE